MKHINPTNCWWIWKLRIHVIGSWIWSGLVYSTSPTHHLWWNWDILSMSQGSRTLFWRAHLPAPPNAALTPCAQRCKKWEGAWKEWQPTCHNSCLGRWGGTFLGGTWRRPCTPGRWRPCAPWSRSSSATAASLARSASEASWSFPRPRHLLVHHCWVHDDPPRCCTWSKSPSTWSSFSSAPPPTLSMVAVVVELLTLCLPGRTRIIRSGCSFIL